MNDADRSYAGRVDTPTRRFRPLAGVRARSTAAAVAVVAVALLIAGVALVTLLERSVQTNAVATASARAQDVAAELVVTGTVTEQLDLQPGPGESSAVQILDRGKVVASSPAIAGGPAMTRLTPPAGRVVKVQVGQLPPGVDDDAGAVYALVALGVVGVSGVDTVAVAQSLGLGENTVAEVVTLLAIGCPLLVLVVGIVTYLLAGRALRPVEDIRRRTEGISGADLTARVPVPATGDEVARLAKTMNDMLARLSSSQRAQRRFISDASHELRSPLASLRVAVEVAALHPEATEWEQTTQDVRAETIRMQRLVDDLLTLAKADENGVLVRHDEVDLDDVVGAEVRRLRDEHRREVRAEITPARVTGDRDQLARVVRNLTDNATRHATSRVTVGVRPGPDRTAILEISDDGPGVAVEQRTRVFDRFVRLDEGRDRTSGGSGLGLAIVREIVTAHGGTVTVDDDAELGGACFRVTLPSE